MNRHYAYVYDDFLSDRSYERVLANVETRCSVLGIQGRVVRLAIFRSARELVEGLVRDGAETIVLVGNDQTLQKVMWFLPDLEITVGYIPVCDPSGIGTILGIPKEDAACDVLAARRMETLDVGMIDDRYFLTEVVAEATNAAVDVEGRYKIAPRRLGRVSVRNLGSAKPDGHSSANARDGKLEVVIEPLIEAPKARKIPFISKFLPAVSRVMSYGEAETRLFMTHGAIRSDEPMDVRVDGQVMNGFTFRLGMVPHKLRIITGRDKKLDPERSENVMALDPLSDGSFSSMIAARWR